MTGAFVGANSISVFALRNTMVDFLHGFNENEQLAYRTAWHSYTSATKLLSSSLAFALGSGHARVCLQL